MQNFSFVLWHYHNQQNDSIRSLGCQECFLLFWNIGIFSALSDTTNHNFLAI
uniref:Uncharacterized protein n=1 Tax=Rhizophora mucronata TaxID=61149 RepID=A0A2P2N797_RHIMU